MIFLEDHVVGKCKMGPRLESSIWSSGPAKDPAEGPEGGGQTRPWVCPRSREAVGGRQHLELQPHCCRWLTATCSGVADYCSVPGLGPGVQDEGLGVGNWESHIQRSVIRGTHRAAVCIAWNRFQGGLHFEVGWGGGALRRRSQGRAIGKGGGLPKPSDRQGQKGLSQRAQRSSN